MATDPTRCAACGTAGDCYEHPLVFAVIESPHLPSVWLCAGCRAVVASRQPDRARKPPKPPRRPSRPAPEAASPEIAALRDVPRLEPS